MKRTFKFGKAKYRGQEHNIRGWYFNKQNKIIILNEDNIRLSEDSVGKIVLIENPIIVYDVGLTKTKTEFKGFPNPLINWKDELRKYLNDDLEVKNKNTQDEIIKISRLTEKISLDEMKDFVDEVVKFMRLKK
ncbi:hypothetical protein KY321_00470 [Candidatus Woesearchaeota archaeon]|nr:hypothetical protein [Candidatus Woesearchaeota archaeon]